MFLYLIDRLSSVTHNPEYTYSGNSKLVPYIGDLSRHLSLLGSKIAIAPNNEFTQDLVHHIDNLYSELNISKYIPFVPDPDFNKFIFDVPKLADYTIIFDSEEDLNKY